jgi:ribonuclease HI
MKPKKNNTFSIFTDGSFDPRSKIGVGCKLVLNTEDCQNLKAADLKSLPFEIKDFDQTNAARLELQTILWALESFTTERSAPQLTLYTDSKTAEGLLERRSKLQKTDYVSARQGIQLANADLYQEFFTLHDRLNFEVVWLEGHTNSSDLNATQSLFSEVDQFARKTLRERLKSQNQVADKWF